MSKERDELNEMVRELEPMDRARVEAYASKLRAFLELGGVHANIAYAIVGQELTDRVDEDERKAAENPSPIGKDQAAGGGLPAADEAATGNPRDAGVEEGSG